MKSEQIRVESYSGFKAAESPRSFEYKGHVYKVSKIEKTWFEENVKEGTRKVHFRVIVEDRLCEISYDPKSDIWFLERFI
jgi:hypothetical protein